MSFIYHPTGNSTGLGGKWVSGSGRKGKLAESPLLGDHPWSPLATRSVEGSTLQTHSSHFNRLEFQNEECVAG